MCGNFLEISTRITRSTRLPVFSGASWDIANRLNSNVLPSFSILATGEVQMATA
jgi:hypothetical protein